jgi:hypothetical protein
MDLFAIRRRQAWSGPDELEQVAARSKQIGDAEMSDQVRWIRTYVINDGDTLGSICIYEAVSADALRDHAQRVGMPADEVTPIIDTVIVRPDPEPAQASA